MKKILVTAFENKEGHLMKPPADLFSADATAYVIPVDRLSDVKELSDHSVQGSYTSNIIVKGIEIDG